MSILISLVAFIVALGLLVTFHEFGHFYVARRLGVKVLRFSVGFGKPLYRRKGKDGVDYVLAAIPLGGYVKMLDEREGPVPEELQAHAFNRQPLFARTLIVLAGPVFNFIFAIFAYWLMFLIGITGIAPIIGTVTPDSIADKHQLQPMMEILQVDDNKTDSWQQVVNQLLPHIGGKNLSLTMQMPDSDERRVFTLDIHDWVLEGKEPDILGSLGVEPFRPSMPPIIGSVIDGAPAEIAGLQPGDKVLAVNGEPVEFWLDFVKAMMPHPNENITLTVERQGQALELDAQLTSSDYQGKTIGYLGVMVETVEIPANFLRKEHYGVWMSFVKALDRTWHYVALTFKMLGKMVTGKIGLESISGPITIAQGAGATVSIGIQYYLGFLGLISVSLGVINLLPIPVLDGGHLMFYAIEAVTRRTPSEKFIQVSYQIGMILLLGLMTLAFYNDIIRLI